MTLTLLFDLDDTLLNNDIHRFLPPYLNLLGKHLGHLIAPEKMVGELLRATQAMVSKNSPMLTLEQAFDQAFYPAIGQSKEDLRAMLEQFYDEMFPSLQSYTSQRAEAVDLIRGEIEKRHTVVVATNPLFPQKAIYHRLRWAGLDPDQVPFALVTTYERFHFSKPNPAYFAEILAQLGWPAQSAVVIGNSLEDDLLPAAALGLPGFWVTPQPVDLPQGHHPLSSAGTLAEVPGWLKRIERAGIRQELDTPAALLAVLKSTPAALDTLCMGLSERQWQERPSRDEWSTTEILAHMRDVDLEINIPRLDKIFTGSNPFVPGVNSDTWADERGYIKENGPAALQGFIQARSELVKRLETLSEQEWQLPARHAIFGPTHLRELVSFTATHDRSHIQQVLAGIRSFPA